MWGGLDASLPWEPSLLAEHVVQINRPLAVKARVRIRQVGIQARRDGSYERTTSRTTALSHILQHQSHRRLRVLHVEIHNVIKRLILVKIVKRTRVRKTMRPCELIHTVNDIIHLVSNAFAHILNILQPSAW